jgi:DUF2075 family protein
VSVAQECVWGTVSEMIDSIENDLESLVQSLSLITTRRSGSPPKTEQISAWKGSLNTVRNSLLGGICPSAHVILEYKLPMSGESVDLLLLGMDENNTKSCITIELKGIKTINNETDDTIQSEFGLQQHPCWQARNYSNRLKNFHSAGNLFEHHAVVWAYNLPKGTFKKRSCQIFETENTEIIEWVSKIVSNPISEEEVQELINGDYSQNEHLFELIENNYDQIRKDALNGFMSIGAGPTERQHIVINNIIKAIKSDESWIFLIKGKPGSGKSYLAFLLLLEAFRGVKSPNKGENPLKNGGRAILGYRNNRLLNTAKKILDNSEPGMGGLLKFFHTKFGGHGIADDNPSSRTFSTFDVAIYDEAQRLNDQHIPVLMKRAPITVFLYDEDQILNEDEEGTTANFYKHAEELELRVLELSLDFAYRCQGGEEYHKFVEDFLQDPKSVQMLERNNNRLSFCKDFSSLYDDLKAIQGLDSQIALVAAFTESDGDSKNLTSPTLKNRRVGNPLQSESEIYSTTDPEVYWLMDAKNQYPAFWNDPSSIYYSNKLSYVSSVYGCQGFEADHIGIIWGRDLVVREGKWTLGDECRDATQIATGKRDLKRIFSSAKRGSEEDTKLAIKLLKNRYRIFLTRGLLSSTIFFEDIETRDFIISNLGQRIAIAELEQ